MLDLQNNRYPIRTEPPSPAVSVAIEHGKQSSEGEAGLMLEKVAEWYIYQAGNVLKRVRT